jgi:cytochrome c oxidase subunit 3
MVSSSLFALVIGTVQYFHGYSSGFLLFKAALLLTIMGAAYWWNDVVIEATFKGDHTKKVRIGIAQGFILFIVSEVMAFLSIFWAYLHASLSPAIELGSCWPPIGITPLDAFAIPFINTLILLSSGGFITYAHHAIIANNRKSVLSGLLVTITLALIFTYLQYVEYNQATFTFADSVYGSAFFASTGLHGGHVLIGTIFIYIQYVRISNYHLTSNHHLGLELSILYWHFVDAVWLFLFCLVYFWGGNIETNHNNLESISFNPLNFVTLFSLNKFKSSIKYVFDFIVLKLISNNLLVKYAMSSVIIYMNLGDLNQINQMTDLPFNESLESFSNTSSVEAVCDETNNIRPEPEITNTTEQLNNVGVDPVQMDISNNKVNNWIPSVDTNTSNNPNLHPQTRPRTLPTIYEDKVL